MSQAVIDFCDRLKETLLAVEARLEQAKDSLETSAEGLQGEAKKHIDEAAEQLASFRAHAGVMAEAIRADAPTLVGAMREKLKDAGLEAQVALRHAAVFLAESASKSADSAAAALKVGAAKAHAVAETLKHETAVTVATPPSSDASSG